MNWAICIFFVDILFDILLYVKIWPMMWKIAVKVNGDDGCHILECQIKCTYNKIENK